MESAVVSVRRFAGLAEEEGDLVKVRVDPLFRKASGSAEDGTLSRVCLD